MNYRHAYHAGNFADVFKHLVLVLLVEYLKRKDKAFRVYDIHGGIGLYDLTSPQAAKTGEWRGGIGRLAGAELPQEFLDVANPYLEVLRRLNPGFDRGEISLYPGSPWLIRQLLRKSDRLSAYELHGEDFQQLKSLFAGDVQVRVNELDGWLVSNSHVPPKEKRGLLVVDPPFEDGKDFQRILALLKPLHQRWREGMALIWYPMKHVREREEFENRIGELARQNGLGEMMFASLAIAEPALETKFYGSALLIKNPPFTLEADILALGPSLCQLLGVAGEAQLRLQMV